MSLTTEERAEGIDIARVGIQRQLDTIDAIRDRGFTLPAQQALLDLTTPSILVEVIAAQNERIIKLLEQISNQIFEGGR